jgi:hypothetical protein
MPDTDLQRRADEHLAEVRRRLASFLDAAMKADGLTLAALSQKLGFHKDTGKNLIFRMLNPDNPDYPNSQIVSMNLVLTFLDLGWGDLDPKHIRPTQVGDVSQAIMELDLDEDKRIKMRIIWETVYQAVREI